MTKHFYLSLFVLILFSLILSIGCEKIEKTSPLPIEQLIPPEGKYDVTIYRDEWGVPHIYGKKDTDVAYGLAYAQCEDDFKTVQDGQILIRGKSGLVNGFNGFIFDYMLEFLNVWDIVNSQYETDLSDEIRAICEAYAEGVNHYAGLHPDKVICWDIFPATGKDIVAGFVLKAPLFFGLNRYIEPLFKSRKKPEIQRPKMLAKNDESTILKEIFEDLPLGSNTFAVSPKRTADGSTFLDVNSHQPWTGPVAWYEARLKSEEGWNITGGVFPGAPIILHGHNQYLGWAHTVNMPDLVDVYELTINPENPCQYRMDGQWKNFERKVVYFPVKIFDKYIIKIPREILFCDYGPAIRRAHGVYALRYAGYKNIKQVEQWYRMNKATNINEFEEALKIRGIPSFNIGYADYQGNIWYIYNALLPIRSEKYNWKGYLPGDTSETLWTEYLPFEKLPQVKNPQSGFIQNCNSTPFQTTIGNDNPNPANYSLTFGIEPPEHMTNRALRLLELLGSDDSITKEEFYEYKFDWTYSKNSLAKKYIEKLFNEFNPETDIEKQAIELLKNWDLKADPDNLSAGIAILTLEPVVRAEILNRPVPDLFKTFREKIKLLYSIYGKVDVPWKEINRLIHGKVNIGLGGGPDLLYCVYGEWTGKYLEGRAGDSYILLVIWDKDGKVHSQALHQFGSATQDENSPHYADQAYLFAERKMRTVHWEFEELKEYVAKAYKPGKEGNN
ncbi:MAG TPA: acylase [Candidatus Hydrogenedens sp.]|nr:acylase [Candidatus Hydrogenedens sp.]